LFTVCPKCTLTLVVTTVDLRAGQGYVRCGRCSNVFNALIALREGDPATGTSDSANRRLLETAPKSIDPAPGVGVEMDPVPELEPELEPEPELEFETVPEEIVLAEETPLEPDLISEEGSLEFDAAATDVSEIFISPSEAEHDTASGNYEAVILQIDPPLEPSLVADAGDDLSHTDTVAADNWSLLDDDPPPADAESVIEESPLTFGGSGEALTPSDPAWVEQMFAEAEAQALAKITPAPEHAATSTEEAPTDGEDAAPE